MAVMYIEYYLIDRPDSTSTLLIEDQQLPEKQFYIYIYVCVYVHTCNIYIYIYIRTYIYTYIFVKC